MFPERAMNLLNLTLQTPAENLACDEALLDLAESGQGGEVLRFWESRQHFVVVGYANRIITEVEEPACQARGVPILRRCSGGGTVVQGPGCLNYALVLKISEDAPTRSISAANEFIMQLNRAAIQSVMHDPQSLIQVCGHTDLALNGMKFSGNSQRRRRHFLLFHGTFLLGFDLTLIAECLKQPSQEPDYRAGRTHSRFITNLDLDQNAVMQAMAAMWKPDCKSLRLPSDAIARLVAEKYGNAEWNRKF
jgi:lipoate-protein ligase A